MPLLILAGGFAAFFALGLDRHLSFATLRENRDALNAWVQSYGLLAPAVYMLTYAAVIAFSLPGGAVMSIAGGFLFGWVWATACIVVAATVGATAVFIIAKTSLGDPLRAKAGPWMKKMEAGFRENALSYLLVLRLVPLFPFWLVNLVPAFLGVPLRTSAPSSASSPAPSSMPRWVRASGRSSRPAGSSRSRRYYRPRSSWPLWDWPRWP